MIAILSGVVAAPFAKQVRVPIRCSAAPMFESVALVGWYDVS